MPRDFKLIELEIIDSTNLEARRLISNGLSEDTIIITNSQTAGRGRYGRSWSSPKGNLYFSMAINYQGVPKDPAQYTFISAVALTMAIASFIPNDRSSDLNLKWPNDVLLNGKKVAGILLEFLPKVNYNEPAWLVIGIGVNLISYPENVNYPATSLKESGSVLVSPRSLLDQFVIQFTKYEEINKLKGFETVRKEWLMHAWGIGKEISCELSNKKVSGKFIGLSQEGACLIETSSGVKAVSSGEVFFQK